MTSEHTPGPWSAKALGNGNYIIISGPGQIENRPFNRVNDLIVGAAYERMDIERLPAEANARLLAAAPDLYVAVAGEDETVRPIDWVSALLERFEHHYNPDNDEDPDAVFEALVAVRRLVTEARAAIAKSEGR